VVSGVTGYIGGSSYGATWGIGTGEVAVSGTGSRWTNSGSVIVGLDGIGTLTIADSATVSAASGVVIAELSGSSGTLQYRGCLRCPGNGCPGCP